MTAAAETRLRVRYAETDQMGVVYYANYLVWMEVGRVELCKKLGFDYRDMEQDGILMAVAEANCRYLSPARFDDEVVVRTWIEDANFRVIKFAYEMRTAEEDRKLASGFTRHLLVDRQFQRIRLPEKYFPMFGLVAK
jgi:acyl-CoA thioester hydrolase